MQNELYENNKVTIAGRIVSEFSFIKELRGKKLYRVYVEVPRLSGQMDTLPVMVTDDLIDPDIGYPEITVTGQYRSYNLKDSVGKSHLILTIYAKEIRVGTPCDERNDIFLDGYICKEPSYRETPLGREITDFLMVVNRPCGKSDYIPCICWGGTARFASGLTIGTRVRISGRVQSREYMKELSRNKSELRVAYEVSASQLKVLKEGC